MLCIIPLSVPLIGLVNCSNIVENATSPQVTFTHSTKYFTNNARNILNEIKSKFDVIEIENNRSSVVGGKEKQIQIPSNRKQFFKDYSLLEWNDFIHKYVPNTWKSKMANVGRILIGYMPFSHILFKLIMKKKNASFRKNIEKINRDT